MQHFLQSDEQKNSTSDSNQRKQKLQKRNCALMHSKTKGKIRPWKPYDKSRNKIISQLTIIYDGCKSLFSELRTK